MTNTIQQTAAIVPSGAWVPILAPAVALLAVLISGITAWLTHHNGKRQIMYPIRAKWIELLREAVAAYIDGLHSYLEAYSNYNARVASYAPGDNVPESVFAIGSDAEDRFMHLSRLRIRVALLLDMRESTHQTLHKEIASYGAIVSDIINRYKSNDSRRHEMIASELGAHMKRVTENASTIVTSEWNTIAGRPAR
jgi:hypothetical protein